MDAKRVQDEEYELQYYEFTSTAFIAQFKELILTNIKTSLDDTENELVLKLPQERISECRRQFNNLYEEYKRIILKHLNNVEADIRGYLAIPPHVLLPEDKNIVPCPKSVVHTLESEIKQLEEAYAQKRAFKFACEKELETLEKFEVFHHHIIGGIKIPSGQKVIERNSSESLVKLRDDLVQKLMQSEKSGQFIVE